MRPTAEQITRHHAEAAVVYVDAHPTGYTVRIEESDTGWPARYDELAAQILTLLGDRALDIQHIGSTSVPGMPAKPIIDIDLTVADPGDEVAYSPALKTLGYVHWITEPEWHGHRLFKMLTEPRVHLHVFGPECPEVVRHTMFRDWLRTHPQNREQYAAAKRAAVEQMAATGDDNGALGFGMRLNQLKEPVVHAIYERMFRAAGLID